MKIYTFVNILIWIQFTPSCNTPSSPQYFAQGNIAHEMISSQVDSPLASYFIEKYLKNDHSNKEFDEKISSFIRYAQNGDLTNQKLKRISEQGSLDLSAMIFAHIHTQKNPKIKQSLLQNYQAVKENKIHLHLTSKNYKVILIPGLFYQSKPQAKGDLRDVKSILEKSGFEVKRAPILDTGTVEENSKIVAEFIQKESYHHKKIILISASKGGPETAYALGSLMPIEATKKVAIWLSIGGALRGSPLANQWLSWPHRWLASTIGYFSGFSLQMLESLSIEQSTMRMNQISIPSHIRTFQLVGVPLSGTVIKEVQSGYKKLKKYGPNDGIVLLQDQIIPGSSVIIAMGLDHWYRDPDLKRKVIAFIATVTRNSDKYYKEI
ncbi:MAG: hypothetical protein AB8C84_12605 [Oligoflexales bacterium]